MIKKYKAYPRPEVGRKILPLIVAVAVLASCTSAPRYRTAPADQPVAGPSRLDVVTAAKSFIGTPYQNGGASRKGMDCSGLVIRVFDRFDIELPRRSLDQSRVGKTISRFAVEPGDLVFFKTTRGKPVSHVGIYIGDGEFVHASTSARQVRIDALDSDYFKRRFVVAKRVLSL